MKHKSLMQNDAGDLGIVAEIFLVCIVLAAIMVAITFTSYLGY